MSNNYWDDEDEDDTTITGNEFENDLQKKLRKKIKADEKRMKELEEKLDQALRELPEQCRRWPLPRSDRRALRT